MPELPEMHAYTRELNERLAGATLSGATLDSKRTNIPRERFDPAFIGRGLVSAGRRGKELALRFDGGHELGIHLMISGKLKVDAADTDPPGNRVASLEFSNGQALHAYDRQRLMKFMLDPDWGDAPDALAPEVDADYLRRRFAEAPRTNVKAFLLDQDKLRGIGNAYSDEILWVSRIAPQSKCGKLPDEVVERLATTIREVLEGAVALVDSLDSPMDYRSVRELNVHVPKREKSPTGVAIEIATVGGRKAYFTAEQVVYA